MLPPEQSRGQDGRRGVTVEIAHAPLVLEFGIGPIVNGPSAKPPDPAGASGPRRQRSIVIQSTSQVVILQRALPMKRPTPRRAHGSPAGRGHFAPTTEKADTTQSCRA